MDAMTMLEGLAMVACAICLITFSVMATGGIFTKHEACKPEEKDDDIK